MENKRGKIAWVFGYPCSGKTFNGDYLAQQGWVNIDGDYPLRSSDPEVVADWKALIECIMMWTNGVTEFTEEQTKCWQKHHRNLCEQALEVANTGKNAIISFVCYKKCVRDYCRTLIPDIEYIHIHVDTEILIPKFKVRMEKAFPPGIGFKEMWSSKDPNMIMCRQRYGDEFTEEACSNFFRDNFYSGFEEFDEAELAYAHKINNNDYSKQGVADLRKIAGLEGDFEYNPDAVEAVQIARYKEVDWSAHMQDKMKERTFIMIKPDGVQRGLIGKIIERFEEKGFMLVAMKICQPGQEHMEKHYADLSSKGFFKGLIEYMCSGPVCAMVWEGDNSVATGRKMLGATKPSESEPGKIRGDFCIDVGRNICHGSDSVFSAAQESKLWFKDSEINKWKNHSES